jgi:hypothetical protein
VDGTGLSIGNAARINGIRLNYRDARLEEVNGPNFTIWRPYRPASGTINGVATGIANGARDVTGVTLGLASAEATGHLTGLSFGGLGLVAEGPRVRWVDVAAYLKTQLMEGDRHRRVQRRA